MPPSCQPIFVSALRSSTQPLVDVLSRRISVVSDDEGQDLFLSRQRHVHLLEEAIDALTQFQGSLGRDRALAAQNLRDATDLVGEIAGTVVNETVLNAIFSQFCIGK
jgi:tRNA U34 5-carboxymethylaminomethyl modifying GTPase MnmE/TrmE